MRAHAVEPTLSWPTDGRRIANRPSRPEASAPEVAWSSKNVARAELPLARVAALLLSISQNNSYEGRNPTVMPEQLSSGFVADLLSVDIGTLAALLVDLRRRGLVESGSHSTLLLKDINGLQQLAS